jgi:Polyketide cyclase / dehydrase and lipid transport
MGRQRIEHTATTTADAATVYALLREGDSWPSWSPIDSVVLERPGSELDPEGVGAVRVLRSGKVEGRDTIAELVPDRRFSYTHESSLPVRNYRGDVDLTPVEGGTEIRWASEFEPKFPGTGWLVARGIRGFITKMTDGLAAGASSRASQPA